MSERLPPISHARDCAYVVNDGPAPCTCDFYQREGEAIEALAPAPASSVGEGWIERVAVGLSDKIIMRLDIEEDDRRLSGIIDELRADLSQALATADRTPAPADAALVEALEFYADESGWNDPPVQTVNHEIFGKAYQNQASKVRQDRGRIARQALAALRSPDDLAKGRGK